MSEHQLHPRNQKPSNGKDEKKRRTKKDSTISEPHSPESTMSEDSLDDLESGVSDTSAQTCCIYRVPPTLAEINDKKRFVPLVVSIGPYHHGKPKLSKIQMHKQRFLSILRSRTQKSNDDLMESIRQLETKARACYSDFKSKQDNNEEFLDMMILDGCFILELFRMADKTILPEPSDHPRDSVSWAERYFYGDLLLLENQIPFFVLEKLFETSKMSCENYSLSLLALRFFNKVMPRSPEELIKRSASENLRDSLHLLDLVRKSFITSDLDQPQKNEEKTKTPVIYCISKLLKAGIQIKRHEEANSFLEVKFRNGVIEMPKITFDYFMNSFLVNCRAFEQLDNNSSKHVTVYASFLDCLVNTAKDVEYLYERKIIDSYVGKNGEVVRFINKLGKEAEFDSDQFYLAKLFDDVDHHYRSSWNVQWTSFKRRYCNTPWTCISAFAAFVLLVLTFLQTFYTIYAYVHPK